MRNREIPRGLRDLLPDEVKVRRNIEKKALDLFTSYGYEEVITPTFEFLEVVETGTNMREELFLFMDREGGILSLRPEVTLSIARLAATHLQDATLPQRLYYMSNVFRHVQPQVAQYREFWQLGIELLGASGTYADAEVITIAVKTMREIGLDNFKVSLNQMGIFNSLLDDSGMNNQEKEMIRNLIEKKDLVELSRVLENMAIDDGLKETIAILPVLHGGLEVLNRIPYVESNRNASQAVSDLLKVYEALQDWGVIDNIVVDMGVLRGLDYYTGIVFEGYSPDLGYGLLGGGRYDNLLGQFGFPCPATGFALGIDRLALVLKHRDEEPRRFLVGGTDFKTVVQKAEELRSQGYIVEIDVKGSSREELEKRMENRENCSLIYAD
ncbi:MAG: ATP phosphoribosyltransferase regulatory subunit [Syntrophomonadaceae bacterium]|nr:ATP phosphoribosyltransferase regulatory subunit [Syntrophomonadaceae bacterium]MDD4548343.1 ATP phosphoribosyltransferase regulatory subunit [Syntrophomonadaceae bacterium]